ncbi:MAG: AAA family ATPase [Alphaproteobacteria bacterium]|nr:AAA family ATPase [Alphaproteobacteria bacterium]
MIIDKDIKHLNRFHFMDLAEHLADEHKAKRISTLNAETNVNSNQQNFNLFFDNIIKELSDLLSPTKNESNSQKIDNISYAISKFKKHEKRIANRLENGFINKYEFADLSHAEIIEDHLKITGNPEIHFSDTAETLAHSLLYLGQRGERKIANVLLNHYMAYTNDLEGLPLVYSYILLQALTENTTSTETTKDIIHEITTSEPMLIATGGLSGSGKSRLSREIASYISPFPGAMILRTDIIRKHLCGALPHEKLPKDKYTLEYNIKTYKFLFEECKKALAAGIPIIADGVFAQQQERETAETIAKKMNVPFYGFWVDAPIDVRTKRVMSRLRNPSDIKERTVLDKQLTYDVGKVTWHKIDSTGPREQTVNNTLNNLL